MLMQVRQEKCSAITSSRSTQDETTLSDVVSQSPHELIRLVHKFRALFDFTTNAHKP